MVDNVDVLSLHSDMKPDIGCCVTQNSLEHFFLQFNKICAWLLPAMKGLIQAITVCLTAKEVRSHDLSFSTGKYCRPTAKGHLYQDEIIQAQ